LIDVEIFYIRLSVLKYLIEGYVEIILNLVNLWHAYKLCENASIKIVLKPYFFFEVDIFSDVLHDYLLIYWLNFVMSLVGWN